MTRPAKLSLRFAFTGVMATTQAADPLIDRLRSCATEVNEAKRLACYDAAIGRSQGGRDDDIGVTGDLLRNKRREAELTVIIPEDMSATVVSVIQPLSAKLVITLDNGQIWSQREVLDFPLQVGDVVTVRHGVLGVLWMSNGRRRLETRVQCVRLKKAAPSGPPRSRLASEFRREANKQLSAQQVIGRIGIDIARR
jgi:hypothetical protein